SQPLLPLFYSDLLVQSRLLQEFWAAQDMLHLEESLRTLSGGARLANFDRVAALAKVLAELVTSYRLRPQEIPQEKREGIEHSIVLIKALSETEISQLSQKIEESGPAIESLCDKLKLQDLETGPPKEMPPVPPKVPVAPPVVAPPKGAIAI